MIWEPNLIVSATLVAEELPMQKVRLCRPAKTYVAPRLRIPHPVRARLLKLGPQVRTFVNNEDQNFSLFNYVNEQQNEVEKLEEQLHQLEQEEKKFTQVVRFCRTQSIARNTTPRSRNACVCRMTLSK